MIVILLGILASVFTEVATAINKLLNNTVLKGEGAFLLAFGMAFVAAVIKEITLPGFYLGELTNWSLLLQFFSETFTVSQVFFLAIYQQLGLDMNSDGTVAGPVSSGALPAAKTVDPAAAV
jgi:hypothetical protein